jgi:hypothetical protein
MSSFWHWIVDNKQWLFSGVAVTLIGYFVSMLLRERRSGDQKTSARVDGALTHSPSAIGHTVYQTVNYQNLTATPGSADRNSEQNKATLPTAHKILKAIDLLPPFQRAAARQSYFGLKVCWLAKFNSIEPDVSTRGSDLHRLFLLLRADFERPALVICEVSLITYPKLKILHEDHPVWIRGKISRVDDGAVYLSEPELDIVDLPE